LGNFSGRRKEERESEKRRNEGREREREREKRMVRENGEKKIIIINNFLIEKKLQKNLLTYKN
jgi:hypothetical protein